MGCNSSSVSKMVQASGPASKTKEPSPLSEDEIALRIDAATEIHSLVIDGVSMRYSWVSQRGFYPNALDKENQDAYVIIPNIGRANTTDKAFFGIFDGHGKDGHHCARFVRDHLPKNIMDAYEAMVMQSPKSTAIKDALFSAHLVTNDMVRADKQFDDSLSGTTAISIFFRGRTMYISNVGDSRAIIVSETADGRYVAKALSNDQTPYRKDERERIKKTGARILSMEQIEGFEPVHENWGDLTLGEDIDEGGDPPRVWSQNGDYPGTAFTRSLGDSIAEECGVIPEPEIVEREITQMDRYIVLASDGVFEFLTNQMVADELNRHPDPLVACKSIVQTAYDLWLQYEERTDDITVVAFYIDDVTRNRGYSASSSFFSPETNGSFKMSSGSGILKASDSIKSTNGGGLTSASTTDASSAALHDTVHSIELDFLDNKPVRRVASRDKRKNMIQLRRDSIDSDLADAQFSEEDMASLITVKSDKDTALISAAIKNNFLFQHLNAAQRSAVIGVMKEVIIKEGDRVIRQGDRGDLFYLIDSGKFEVRVLPPPPPQQEPSPSTTTDSPQNSPNSSPPRVHSSRLERILSTSKIEFEPNRESLGNAVHVYESGPNQHPGFGELSLMYGKPRAASVIALTPGKLWALDRRVFQQVVLRPRDHRRSIIRTLKKVALFSCLNLAQLQRLTDLLCEESFSAGDTIIQQGTVGDTFYLIQSGNCQCTVNSGGIEGTNISANEAVSHHSHGSTVSTLSSTVATPKNDSSGLSSMGGNDDIDADTKTESTTTSTAIVVQELHDFDYFGEHALLESKPHSSNVVAITDVAVLFIGRESFEEVLGPLSQIMAKHNQQREAMAAATALIPHSLDDLTLNGVVTSSAANTLILGTFKHSTPNICIQSFVLSELKKHAQEGTLVRFIDVVKVLIAGDSSNCVHVPKFLSFVRMPNAVHVLFESPVVTDLSGVIRANSENFVSTEATATCATYAIACIVAALEHLHDQTIVYRAVQPESIHVDAHGRVVLMDFRVSKVGMAAGSRTYTICGASDYLAPEQISQAGHSLPVDLWALGVLLYEISVGSHPFSSSSEVATYSKISSFGSKAFPKLTFPDCINSETKSLINQLLMPVPMARIGSGAANGFSMLKKHAFFHDYADWDPSDTTGAFKSPLLELVSDEQEAILREGVDDAVLTAFAKPGTNSDSWSSMLQL